MNLRIDEIVIDLDDDTGLHIEEAQEAVRAALTILASRLAGTPLGGGRAGLARGLDRIELEPLPPQWLSTPQAAERIADELYRQIAGGAR